MTNTATHSNSENDIEVISIEDTEIDITNVYIPPVNSIGTHYHPNITHLLQDENRIILDDFYPCHDSWYSLDPNAKRGIAIAEQIEESEFATINGRRKH